MVSLRLLRVLTLLWSGMLAKVKCHDDFLVVDYENHRIQRCQSSGSNCTTIAGRTRSSLLGGPLAVTEEIDGDFLVADFGNHRIQRCPLSGDGNCTTVVGTSGISGSSSTQLRYPRGVAVESNEHFLVADSRNYRIQRCPMSGDGSCITVAGSGTLGTSGVQASTYFYPTAVAIDSACSFLVADFLNNRIQRCPSSGSGDCMVVAGSGSGSDGTSNLHLSRPSGIAVESSGDFLVADSGNHRIQRCPASGFGNCTTVAGISGNPGSASMQLNNPTDVAVERGGDFLVADKGNHRILRCPASGSGNCVTIASGSPLASDYSDEQFHRVAGVMPVLFSASSRERGCLMSNTTTSTPFSSTTSTFTELITSQIANATLSATSEIKAAEIFTDSRRPPVAYAPTVAAAFGAGAIFCLGCSCFGWTFCRTWRSLQRVEDGDRWAETSENKPDAEKCDKTRISEVSTQDGTEVDLRSLGSIPSDGSDIFDCDTSAHDVAELDLRPLGSIPSDVGDNSVCDMV